MDKRTFLVMDPGQRNWAWCFFRHEKPVKFGYLSSPEVFDLKDVDTVSIFLLEVSFLLGKADALIIERYFGRQAARGVSIEKINLMIGLTLAVASIMVKELKLATPHVWKRKIPYKLASDYANKLGYLRKDSHLVDTLLMYSVLVDSPEHIIRMLKLGRLPYARFKETNFRRTHDKSHTSNRKSR
jgi:hypothetical protein